MIRKFAEEDPDEYSSKDMTDNEVFCNECKSHGPNSNTWFATCQRLNRDRKPSPRLRGGAVQTCRQAPQCFHPSLTTMAGQKPEDHHLTLLSVGIRRIMI
jgi:hypothetical protein